MTEILSEELFEVALMAPLSDVRKPDTLRIVSGYATPAMAVRHLLACREQKELLNVDLIYGMAGSSGVSVATHLGFLSLAGKQEFAYDGSFQCSYVKKPQSVHAKVYVWCKGEEPLLAFTGSANYSEAGFISKRRTEVLAECDPYSANAFFNSVKAKETVLCQKANRERDFAVRPQLVAPVLGRQTTLVTLEQNRQSPFYGLEKIVLSLLTKQGDVGNGSRLNWGVRPNGTPRESKGPNGRTSYRDPNQAYIGLPVQFQRLGFFPDAGRRFTVLTDDNQVLTCVRAQANGKGIETPQDNAEIGRYFRNRMGLASGAYISIDDLKRYGRCDVTFYKLDEENYVMDFSRPN